MTSEHQAQGMPELKRCPFCGSANVKYWEAHKSGSNIKCADCEAAGPWIRVTGDSYDASEAWNRRAITNPDRQQDRGSDCRQAPLAWRHVKRGTVYTEIGRGKLQCAANELLDDKPVVIYRGEDGALWVRGVTEFEDGRFERVTSAAQFPSFTLPTKPSPIVSPHSEGVFPKSPQVAEEAWSLIEHLRQSEGSALTILADNAGFGGPNSAVEVCAEWTNWQTVRFTGENVVKALNNALSMAGGKVVGEGIVPPVTEQAQPVAVTTHGQLDLIRRDDSGKMFPLDGYLHRSVEAIPLFTSPPDQSALLAEAAEVLEPFAKAADIRLCGEWPDDGRIARTDAANHLTFGHMRRARSLLAKLREVRG